MRQNRFARQHHNSSVRCILRSKRSAGKSPNNKAARLIGGTTAHAAQGLTPDNSLRTQSLALNVQTRQNMERTALRAGAVCYDECSQLQGELHHADALRTTYARQHQYQLNALEYWKATERHGRMAIISFWGDHLQLPPVPSTSSMLAPLRGTNNEHKAGTNIFRNADLIFQFHNMMRFADPLLVQILEIMRTPKPGKKLSETQWQRLCATDFGAAQPDVPADWYHSSYCWSVTSTVAFACARRSAREAQHTLCFRTGCGSAE